MEQANGQLSMMVGGGCGGRWNDDEGDDAHKEQVDHAPARVADRDQIAEPLEALAQESPSPAFDAPHGDSHASRDLPRASSFGTRQDDPRPGGVALCGGRCSYSEGQFSGFLGRQLERQRRPTTSRQGTHLGDLTYRNISEMYSAFSAVMSGPDH